MQTAAVKFQSVLQLKLLRVELFGCQVSHVCFTSHPCISARGLPSALPVSPSSCALQFKNFEAFVNVFSRWCCVNWWQNRTDHWLEPMLSTAGHISSPVFEDWSKIETPSFFKLSRHEPQFHCWQTMKVDGKRQLKETHFRQLLEINSLQRKQTVPQLRCYFSQNTDSEKEMISICSNLHLYLRLCLELIFLLSSVHTWMCGGSKTPA